MRKKIIVLAMLLLIISSVYIGVVTSNHSFGPATDSGDGNPSGNQFIRPDNPGKGPAPNSGDCIPDGSGF